MHLVTTCFLLAASGCSFIGVGDATSPRTCTDSYFWPAVDATEATAGGVLTLAILAQLDRAESDNDYQTVLLVAGISAIPPMLHAIAAVRGGGRVARCRQLKAAPPRPVFTPPVFTPPGLTSPW